MPVIALSRAVGFGLALATSSMAVAHATCPVVRPSFIACGVADIQAAPAGTYRIDPNHTAVIVRVRHFGYSLSVFRFGKVAGTLSWVPATPEASKLTAAVGADSIATPVAGFPEELSGDGFLKSRTYPQITFVSTSFTRLDATHGRVTGDFMFMGVNSRLTFDVELIGAGAGFGSPRIGVEARSMVDPKAYSLPPLYFADPVELVIDAEFVRMP